MKRRVIAVVVAAVVLGAAGYLGWTYLAGGNGAASGGIEGSGSVEADEIAITPQTAGRILVAPSEEGAAVKAGDVLYQLDPAMLRLQVSQAVAGARAARSNWDHVRRDGGSTSAERAVAKAQWEQALIAVDMARVQLGYAVVRSPIDGALSSIAAREGENAVPGSTLAVVSDPASLTVTIFVPESLIGQVTLGQSGTLTTDSVSKPYHGEVVYIASQAEFTPASIETKDQRVKLVYQVKLRVTDADASLKPGMPADVVLR